MPYDAGYSDTDAASTVKAVMDSTKGDMDTAKGLKDTADGNVANLAYFNKVEAKKTENAKYAAAKAALEAVKPTKIDRVKAIMNHMNENGAGLKGTIKDITDAKAAIDSKINTATTGLQAVNDAAAKKKGDLADAVTKAKGEMGVEKGKWDEAKGKAEKALSDADPNLKAVNALREKVK